MVKNEKNEESPQPNLTITEDLSQPRSHSLRKTGTAVRAVEEAGGNLLVHGSTASSVLE
jgi:hypothetical protein